jgi:hypothetical protein
MVSIMSIDVKLGGASRLSRTSGGRTMDGVQDERRVGAAAQARAPRARSFQKRGAAALARHLRVIRRKGFKTIKHSTCRRRLAVAAEVRASVHPFVVVRAASHSYPLSPSP